MARARTSSIGTGCAGGVKSRVRFVAVLFAGLGSVVVEVTLAVLLMTEPPGVEVLTLTVNSQMAEDVLLPRDEIVLVIVPVVPTAGVVVAQPAGLELIATNVVLAGNGSERVTFAAESGPRLFTTMR
jgi:hypothetical protein